MKITWNAHAHADNGYAAIVLREPGETCRFKPSTASAYGVVIVWRGL